MKETYIMYSVCILFVVIVSIHFTYQHLERRMCYVPNALEAQSKERYEALVGDLDTERKVELDTLLEELKH